MFGLLGCIQKSLLLPAQQKMVAEVDKMEQQSPDLFMMRNSHVDRTSARASCTPFAKLRHIPVAALQLDQQHKGCRVEGTVCCKATRHVAVQVLMEDAITSSHAVKVSMYNLMPTSAPMKDVRRLLPEGTKLAIKEPYYKVFLDGTSGIRVDNPADVVLFTESVESEPSSTLKTHAGFDQLKAEGNQAFRSVQHSSFMTSCCVCIVPICIMNIYVSPGHTVSCRCKLYSRALILIPKMLARAP